MAAAKLTSGVLDIDPLAVTDNICRRLVDIVGRDQRRRGLVVALSGGIDSSVCAALSVRALGAGKVFGLLLPEKDASCFEMGEEIKIYVEPRRIILCGKANARLKSAAPRNGTVDLGGNIIFRFLELGDEIDPSQTRAEFAGCVVELKLRVIVPHLKHFIPTLA